LYYDNYAIIFVLTICDKKVEWDFFFIKCVISLAWVTLLITQDVKIIVDFPFLQIFKTKVCTTLFLAEHIVTYFPMYKSFV